MSELLFNRKCKEAKYLYKKYSHLYFSDLNWNCIKLVEIAIESEYETKKIDTILNKNKWILCSQINGFYFFLL